MISTKWIYQNKFLRLSLSIIPDNVGKVPSSFTLNFSNSVDGF